VLAELGTRTSDEPHPRRWEATDLHAVATALVAAATLREETRGAHWREDHPEASDAWRGRWSPRCRHDLRAGARHDPATWSPP
jgi:aspartate oxidase